MKVKRQIAEIQIPLNMEYAKWNTFTFEFMNEYDIN